MDWESEEDDMFGMGMGQIELRGDMRDKIEYMSMDFP